MKYTNYIINGRPVRPETLGYDLIALPAAAVGMVALAGLLPGAMLMDSGRYLKLRYRLFKRKQRNLNYVKTVLRSLDRDETKELINLLIAA